VAAEDDVLDLEVLDAELDGGEEGDVGGPDLVGLEGGGELVVCEGGGRCQ
jgi:hypothetical protein